MGGKRAAAVGPTCSSCDTSRQEINTLVNSKHSAGAAPSNHSLHVCEINQRAGGQIFKQVLQVTNKQTQQPLIARERGKQNVAQLYQREGQTIRLSETWELYLLHSIIVGHTKPSISGNWISLSVCPRFEILLVESDKQKLTHCDWVS